MPRAQGAYAPDPLCLHDMLALQAERTPDALALAEESRSLTYRELDTQANQLAWVLRERGIGPQVVVGLAIEQGRKDLETVVALFAILKAGGAFLILDAFYPEEALREMMGEVGVARVLAVEKREALRVGGGRAGGRCPMLCLDDPTLQQQIARQPTTPPAPGVRPHDLAYVIYTSGSTGRPKGVLCTHEHFFPLAAYHGHLCGITVGDRLSQVLPFRWDGALSMVVTALGNGATLCLPPAEALRPGPQTVAWLARAGVTFALLTPTFLDHLPAAPLPGLKGMILAGEPCPKGLADRWSAGGERQLFFAYGPAEGGICASMYRWDGAGTPTMGHPLPYVQLALLDHAGREVPQGQVGQVVLFRYIALGYTDEAQTKQRFRALPDGRRAYFTGDFARFAADGTLEWMGREDEQHKLPGGVMVNLAGIEHLLSSLEAVRACKVILREQGWIVAYVLFHEPGQLPLSALREALARRLPTPVLSRLYCLELEAFPLSPTGKVAASTDLQLWPLPLVEDLAAYDEQFHPPQTEEELALALMVIQLTESPYRGARVEQINVLKKPYELGIESASLGELEVAIGERWDRDLAEDLLSKPLWEIAASLAGEGAPVSAWGAPG